MRVADNQACIGCPLRGDGSQQFVGDTIKPGAPVYLQTDQAGETDPVQRSKRYIELAGLTPEQVSSGHAIRCTADLPKPVLPAQFAAGKRGPLENAIRYCDRVHGLASGAVRGGSDARPSLVVTQGDLALYAATGQQSAFNWRGWCLPYQPRSDSWLNECWVPGPGDLPVLAMISMSMIRTVPALVYPTKQDWRKVGWILRGLWPKRPPPVITTPDIGMFASGSAWDSEWNPTTGEVLRFSVATRDHRVYVIEWDDWQRRGPAIQRELSKAAEAAPVCAMREAPDTQQQDGQVQSVQRRVDADQQPTVSTQAEAAQDLRVPGVLAGIVEPDQIRDVHQVLLGSVQRAEPERQLPPGPSQVHGPSVLRMPTGHEQTAVRTETHRVDRGIDTGGCEGGVQATGKQVSDLPGGVREAPHRPLPQNEPISGLVMRLVQSGDWVVEGQPRGTDEGGPVPIGVIGQNIIVDLPNLSRVFPVGSLIEIHDEMLAHHVLWPDLAHDLDFLASIYSPINRHKHLYRTRPILYAGMDAFVQLRVWVGLLKELQADADCARVYSEEVIPLWGPILEAETVGLRLDQDRVTLALETHEALRQEVCNEAMAYAGYPLLLSSPDQVARHLYEVEKVGVKQRRKR